jgi:hypothetical protein
MWKNFVQKERNNRKKIYEIMMDMGKYFPCKWEKIDFFKGASRKIHQGSHRFYIWNRIVIRWRIFVQKERNTLYETIMDMGKYFTCKWGKN